ncbi:suppressor-of-stellate-like protein [Drosophila novamexicana]|uniref:suppressor-of-stellate-like protein n=1 Tax=Drosophila novamexicana TaxID=47314 RepID=UPI0011E5C1B2|nr:suppressor-of-stellate-like protein [Drosophila novamexicana]XP_030554236.1 suppressor-of-stellate-like protein [Drosophila novamexicana]
MSKPDGSWINWFVNLQANEFLCRVPYEYARDKFNLTGLETMVSNFQDTLDAILDSEFNTEYGFEDGETHPEKAEQLYGLIHARYILTRRGIADMCVKYQRGDFGICPRIYCNGQVVLPLGLTDRIGESHVKVYCPRCQDIYQPNARCALLDGAMFGCSFPHMFFMQLPHLLPEPPSEKYTPRIYGFKLHKLALMPPSAELPAGSDYPTANSPKKELASANAKPVDSNRLTKRRYNFSLD